MSILTRPFKAATQVLNLKTWQKGSEQTKRTPVQVESQATQALWEQDG